MPYCQTFGAVEKGKPLAYLNSLLQLSFALNQGDFAKTFSVASGNDWHVEVLRRLVIGDVKIYNHAKKNIYQIIFCTYGSPIYFFISGNSFSRIN